MGRLRHSSPLSHLTKLNGFKWWKGSKVKMSHTISDVFENGLAFTRI